MNKPYPPPSVRPVLQSISEMYGVLTSKEISQAKKILHDTPSFSVGLVGRLVRLIPDKPCSLVSWQGKPADGSADLVLWKLAALLKFDPETRQLEPEAHRPMVCRICQHLNLDDDDGWRLFSKSFEKAKKGTGSANQLLQDAKERAQSAIEDGMDSVIAGTRPHYRDTRRRLLVGIFHYALTEIGAPVGSRYISTRDAGSLIGVDASTAAIWIRAMVRDGYLEKIATGNEYRAARYRWIYC